MNRFAAEEALVETALFYNQNKRAAYDKNGGCSYHLTKKRSKKCAVARLMTLDAIETVVNNGMNGLDIVTVVSELKLTNEELLQPKWKSLSLTFIADLQQLHDEKRHWDLYGITDKGMEKIRSMCKKFGLDSESVVGKINMERKVAS